MRFPQAAGMKCPLKRDFTAVGAFQGEFGQPNELGAGASRHLAAGICPPRTKDRDLWLP